MRIIASPASEKARVKRKNLTPGALYTLLNDELKQRRPAGCEGACRMPLPFRVERPDEDSANWRIGTAVPCAHGCDTIIAEIVAGLWPAYDLHDPFAIPKVAAASDAGDTQH